LARYEALVAMSSEGFSAFDRLWSFVRRSAQVFTRIGGTEQISRSISIAVSDSGGSVCPAALAGAWAALIIEGCALPPTLSGEVTFTKTELPDIQASASLAVTAAAALSSLGLSRVEIRSLWLGQFSIRDDTITFLGWELPAEVSEAIHPQLICRQIADADHVDPLFPLDKRGDNRDILAGCEWKESWLVPGEFGNEVLVTLAGVPDHWEQIMDPSVSYVIQSLLRESPHRRGLRIDELLLPHADVDRLVGAGYVYRMGDFVRMTEEQMFSLDQETAYHLNLRARRTRNTRFATKDVYLNDRLAHLSEVRTPLSSNS